MSTWLYLLLRKPSRELHVSLQGQMLVTTEPEIWGQGDYQGTLKFSMLVEARDPGQNLSHAPGRVCEDDYSDSTVTEGGAVLHLLAPPSSLLLASCCLKRPQALPTRLSLMIVQRPWAV